MKFVPVKSVPVSMVCGALLAGAAALQCGPASDTSPGGVPDGAASSTGGTGAAPATGGAGGTAGTRATGGTGGTGAAPATGGSGGRGGSSGSGGAGGTAGTGTGGTAGAGTGGTAGTGTGGSGGGPPPVAGKIPTEPNLKVAFYGDTASKVDFESTLKLVLAEKAAFIVHNGDATYDTETPADFWAVVDRVLPAGYPYFMSMGNHDSGAAFVPELMKRVAAIPGVTIDHAEGAGGTNEHFHFVYKGLSMVMVGDNSGNMPKYPPYIRKRFGADPHMWKVCNWHKNMNAMQVGGKLDEMTWDIYEACREMGAMIETAHEHTYSRTKTLTSMTNQTVDTACADAKSLCLGPGRSFVTVSALGGRDVRNQERCMPTMPPYGCKGEWATIYASNQGATFGVQFMIFNYNGDPKKAHGYFKTVRGQMVDEFDVTLQ